VLRLLHDNNLIEKNIMTILNITEKTNLSEKKMLTNSYYNLFYLQKRIYQASKECDTSLVHSLQKLLIFLPSIQLLAHRLTQQKIKYYSANRKNQDTLQKKVFKNEVNKQIVVWCLEAEWKVKLQNCNMERKLISAQVQKITSMFPYFSSLQICLKHMNRNYLITKLGSISWVNNVLKALFENQYLIQVSCDSSCNTRYNCFIAEPLSCLLNLILLTGIRWNCFRQTVSVLVSYINMKVFFDFSHRNIYIPPSLELLLSTILIINNFAENTGIFFLNSKSQLGWIIERIQFSVLYKTVQLDFADYSLKNNIYDDISDKLFHYIKDVLFHKDRIGRLRTNKQLSIEQVILQLKPMLLQWKNYYSEHKGKSQISEINRQVNGMIYKWARKKYKKRQSELLQLKRKLIKRTVESIFTYN
jgi:hypothetical protein